MNVMTDEQAYAAMFQFLEQIWERNRSIELGGVLGGMSLLPDGSPADPAISGDWRLAVEYALQGGKPGAQKN